MAVDREKVVQAALKYAEKKRYDRAIAEYQKILSEDPNDARILLKVAEAQTKGELYPAAIESYERAARIYIQQGFPQKALAVYLQLGELIPRHAPQLEERYRNVPFETAKLHQQLGHVADAIAVWEKIAVKFQNSGHDLDAAEVFKRLIELDGNNPLHRLRLGEAYSRARNSEEAIAQFRSAAELLIQAGNIDNALKVYERLLQIRPDPVIARLTAELYLKRNQGNDAMTALAKLQIAFDPKKKDLQLLILLARSFELIQQPDKAIAVYKEMVRYAREVGDKLAYKDALRRASALAPNNEQVKDLLRSNPTSSIPAPLLKPAQKERVVEDLDAISIEDDFEQIDDFQDLEIEEDPVPPSRSPAIPPPRPSSPLQPVSPHRSNPPSPSLQSSFQHRPQPVVEQYSHGLEVPGVRSVRAVAVPASLRVIEESHASSSEIDVDEESLVQETLDEVAVFRRRRQLPQGIECLRIALEVVPASLPLREQLRDLLLEIGDQDNAIGEMISIATLAIDHGDFDAASNALNETLLLSPGHRRARELLDSLDSLGFGGLEPVEDEFNDAPVVGQGVLHEEVIGIPSELSLDEPDLHHEPPSDDLLFDDDPALALTPLVPASAFDLEEDPFGGVPFERVATYHQRPTERPSDKTPPEPLSLSLDEPVPTASVASGGNELEFDDEPSFEVAVPAIAPPIAYAASNLEADDTEVFSSADLAWDVSASSAVDETKPSMPIGEPSGELELELPPPIFSDTSVLAHGFQGGDTVEEALEEIDFFASRGLYEDARSILEEQLRRTPNHPILLERLHELEEAEAAQSHEEVPYEYGNALRDTVNSEVLDASLEALDSFEPTQEAHGHFQREEAQVDVESVFAKFKEGVKAQVDDDDSATHYDLGVAYKEMGLLQDSISEFLLAAQDPLRECVCYSMVGMIELERDKPEAALKAFQSALGAREKTSEQEIALFYELGVLHEGKGEKATALDYYKKIQRRDPDFRDVAQRIAALEPKRPIVRQLESADDLDLIFDDILGGGKGL